jgi:hypothetical protein
MLEGIGVEITITDSQQTDSLSKFAIGNPTLVGISSMSGNGTLPAKSSGTAEWLIIPRREAAPTEEALYDVILYTSHLVNLLPRLVDY